MKAVSILSGLKLKMVKVLLLGQHVNDEGKTGWEGENPAQHDKLLEVSSNAHNVITYVAKRIDNKSIYIAGKHKKTLKDIYHQLIDSKGKSLWGTQRKTDNFIKR